SDPGMLFRPVVVPGLERKPELSTLKFLLVRVNVSFKEPIAIVSAVVSFVPILMPLPPVPVPRLIAVYAVFPVPKLSAVVAPPPKLIVVAVAFKRLNVLCDVVKLAPLAAISPENVFPLLPVCVYAPSLEIPEIPVIVPVAPIAQSEEVIAVVAVPT